MYKNYTIVILHNYCDKNSPQDILDIEIQAKWVSEILQSKGYTTLLMPFSLDNLSLLEKMNKNRSVLVFNLVDAALHEETLSYLPCGILDYMKLPYTGGTLDNLYITSNKVLTKQLLKEAAIPTPAWVCESETKALLDTSIERFIVKPTCEDASIGLDVHSIVASDAVLDILHTKKNYFAEAFIEGREFTVCMFGDQEQYTLLPPYEWVFTGYEENNKEKIITYDAKWTEGSFGYNHIEAKYKTSECDLPLIELLKNITLRCWKYVNLRGYIRVDFRVDKTGNPWVLEINCNPSFYAFYHLALEEEFSFEDFIESLLYIAN